MVTVVRLCAVIGFTKYAKLDQATKFFSVFFCDFDFCLDLQTFIKTMIEHALRKGIVSIDYQGARDEYVD